jgi:hypothetical protein
MGAVLPCERCRTTNAPSATKPSASAHGAHREQSRHRLAASLTLVAWFSMSRRFAVQSAFAGDSGLSKKRTAVMHNWCRGKGF